MKKVIIAVIALVSLSAFGAADGKIELILLNADSLARARESCRDKNSPLKPAYDRLVRDAKKALDMRPVNVMDTDSN